MLDFKSSICIAFLFLLFQGDAVSQQTPAPEEGEQQQQIPRECKGLSCKHARPVSEDNPFGVDFGWGGATSYSGVPTRALAMAKAQVVFAGENCPKPSKFTAFKFRASFLGIYGPSRNSDVFSLFNEQSEKFKENYAKTWLTLEDSQRNAFCKKYFDDATFKAKTFKAAPSEFYLNYLSPLSDEGLHEFEVKMNRAERLKWLAIFGQVISTAAQVSATHDAYQTGKSAIREGKQGNIDTMNFQFSQSRSLFADSATFGNIGRYFSSTITELNSGTATGVAPSLADDFSANLNCQALVHFSQWDAPPDADIWATYQSLATDCEALNILRIK